MSVISCNDKEKDLLARLMRAEALGEGELGMLMVGNVCINRIICDCYNFKDIDSINKMVYQSPGGFSGVNSPLFFSSPTVKERELASKVIQGKFFYPATNSLWFYAPKSGQNCSSTWYEQNLAGRYKNHCFYEPSISECRNLH